MSKSARVKYPTKREIQHQISNIIDQSHMFEVEQNQSGYVQCKKVKRSFFSSNAATVLIAVAACIIVVLCVGPLLTKGSRSSTAHGNPDREGSTGAVGMENSTQPNNANTYNTCTVQKDDTTLYEEGDLYKVYLSYVTVKATVNGSPAEYVSDFYKARREAVWNAVCQQYVEPQESMTETDISSVYVTNTWSSNVVNPKNIVGIGNIYSISTQYERDSAGDSVRSDYEYMHVDTFNMETEEYLELEDVLKDYKSGMETIADAIYEAVQTNTAAGVKGISQKYMTKAGIKEALEQSSSWQLGSNALIIYCNDFRTFDNGTTGRTKLNMTTYESFVLPFYKYDIIKEEYAN